MARNNQYDELNHQDKLYYHNQDQGLQQGQTRNIMLPMV